MRGRVLVQLVLRVVPTHLPTSLRRAELGTPRQLVLRPSRAGNPSAQVSGTAVVFACAISPRISPRRRASCRRLYSRPITGDAAAAAATTTKWRTAIAQTTTELCHLLQNTLHDDPRYVVLSRDSSSKKHVEEHVQKEPDVEPDCEKHVHTNRDAVQIENGTPLFAWSLITHVYSHWKQCMKPC